MAPDKQSTFDNGCEMTSPRSARPVGSRSSRFSRSVLCLLFLYVFAVFTPLSSGPLLADAYQLGGAHSLGSFGKRADPSVDLYPDESAGDDPEALYQLIYQLAAANSKYSSRNRNSYNYLRAPQEPY